MLKTKLMVLNILCILTFTPHNNVILPHLPQFLWNMQIILHTPIFNYKCRMQIVSWRFHKYSHGKCQTALNVFSI